MRILKFKQFESDQNKPIPAPMKFGNILIADDDRKEINRIIAGSLSKYYLFNKTSNTTHKFGEKSVNSEIIFKAINNHTLIRKLAYDKNKEIITNAKTAEDLKNWIRDNSYELFHYNGKYFDIVYKLLSATHEKGDANEKYAFEIFKKAFREKTGENINIYKGTTNQDIYKDIDGLFNFNNKTYSMQIKPIAIKDDGKPFHISFSDGFYFITSKGALKIPTTNYLILSDEKLDIFYAFKSSEITLTWNNSTFKIPAENLSYTNQKEAKS